MSKSLIPGVELEFMTGSKECPPSINDPPTSIQSAYHVFRKLQKELPSLNVQAILVCCFSDHPLVAMIRHEFKDIKCMHIMDSSISIALSCSNKPFAVLTTGSDMVPDIDKGVLSYMGGNSTRYSGCFASELGVLELADSSRAVQDKVQAVLRQKVHEISQKNVGAIILGCAGYAGKEEFIRSCLVDSVGLSKANLISIIDGSKAGIHLLTTLDRCNFERI